MAKAYYFVDGQPKEWTPDMVGALAVNGNAVSASYIQRAAKHDEKRTPGILYYKIADATCTSAYDRVNYPLLLVTRNEMALIDINVTSFNSKQFTNPTITWTFLSPNAKSATYGRIAAGLDKAAEGNTFSLWLEKKQWDQSINIIPLGYNVDRGVSQMTLYSSGTNNTNGQSSLPTFAVPAKHIINSVVQSGKNEPVGDICQIWIKQ